MSTSGTWVLLWENERKMPFQKKTKHARQPRTTPQMKRTTIVKMKSGHLLFILTKAGYARVRQPQKTYPATQFRAPYNEGMDSSIVMSLGTMRCRGQSKNETTLRLANAGAMKT